MRYRCRNCFANISDALLFVQPEMIQCLSQIELSLWRQRCCQLAESIYLSCHGFRLWCCRSVMFQQSNCYSRWIKAIHTMTCCLFKWKYLIFQQMQQFSRNLLKVEVWNVLVIELNLILNLDLLKCQSYPTRIDH